MVEEANILPTQMIYTPCLPALFPTLYSKQYPSTNTSGNTHSTSTMLNILILFIPNIYVFVPMSKSTAEVNSSWVKENVVDVTRILWFVFTESEIFATLRDEGKGGGGGYITIAAIHTVSP